MDKLFDVSKEVYDILKKYSKEEQLDILRDCGFSPELDNVIEISPKDDKVFKARLNQLTALMSNKYGNAIRGATWKGIYESLCKALLVVNTSRPPNTD